MDDEATHLIFCEAGREGEQPRAEEGDQSYPDLGRVLATAPACASDAVTGTGARPG
jgi:hypothetical protein